MVLYDWPADRSAKLVPFKRGNLTHIEIVHRVKLAVAKKLVGAAVNLIGARTRDCVDHAS